ncbi:hypothetical protein ABPG75_007722 [Micractinium tetrahymenae]
MASNLGQLWQLQGTQEVLRRTHQLPVQRRAAVEAQAFAKSLGLSKPRWLPLPDFGLEKRRTTLGRFFGPIDRQASLQAVAPAGPMPSGCPVLRLRLAPLRANSANRCAQTGSPGCRPGLAWPADILRHAAAPPPLSRQVYEELLEERFKMREQLRDEAGHSRTYGKADWIELMCGCVAPAIPDFKWSAATDGEVDKDGFAIVAVKVSGHHTGAPFAPPGLPPVPAEGRRVALEQQLMRVLVEGGRIREIEVLPSEGAGPLALYKALGGEVSSP